MSGILDSKQRIIDFIFTRNGYSQIQNNDIRIMYASLSDSDAIYATKDGEINVADTNVNPFLFESYSKYTDTMNTEIDLKQTNIFSIKTDLNNKLYDISNNISQKNLQIDYVDSLFSNVNKKLISNISDECILLSHDYLNYDKETEKIKPIEINVTKINNQQLSEQVDQINQIPLLLNDNLKYETTLYNNSINMDRYTMMSDDRFQAKLNYLFLPPQNMKTNTVVLNKNLRNDYVLNNDNRDKSKILVKNLNTPIDIQVNNNFDNIILKSIEYLENQSNAENGTNSISKIDLKFSEFEHDSEFIISLFEKTTDSNELPIFNKLLFVNHGEIYDQKDNKNKQVYSAGKLYQTKISPVNSNNNADETVEDNYVFINLFTIVIK